MRLKTSGLLAFVAILIVVAPVLAAAYSAPYTITETNRNAYTILPVSVSVDNQWLADNGFMESDALDTRVETLGGLKRPHMVVDDRTLTAVSVSADSQTNLYFTTGNSDLSAMDIITGYGGYLTVADAAALELGNDFEIEFDGYIDTASGSGKYLVDKDQAFRTYVSTTSEITSTIYNIETQSYSSGTSTPDIYGVNWQAQTFEFVETVEVSAVTLRIQKVNSPSGSITIALRATSADVPTGANLASVSVVASSIPGSATEVTFTFDTPITLIGGTRYAIVASLPSGDATNRIRWMTDTSSPTYSNGRVAQSTNSGVVWSGVSAWDGRFSVVGAYSVATVIATGVSSGEHKVKVTADTTDLKIYIDDVEEDSVALGGASVPDNGNDWIINQNNVLPYFDYYKHTVSSSLVTRYQPNAIIINTGEAGTADAGATITLDDAILTQANDYWNGARLIIVTTTDGLAPEGETAVVTDFDAANDRLTFAALTAVVDAGDTYTVDFGTLPDREAASNDARITWGVNPDGVAVSLGGMVSEDQPALGGIAEDETTDILPAVEVSDWFEEPDVGGVLLANPLRPFVTLMSDTTTITELQAWRVLALAFILWVTVMAIVLVRSHLLIAGIAAGAAVGLAVSWTIFPQWALVFTIMAVVGGLVSERSPSL